MIRFDIRRRNAGNRRDLRRLLHGRIGSHLHSIRGQFFGLFGDGAGHIFEVFLNHGQAGIEPVSIRIERANGRRQPPRLDLIIFRRALEADDLLGRSLFHAPRAHCRVAGEDGDEERAKA